MKLMIKQLKYASLLLIMLSAGYTFAQKDPMKYGKIDIEDLKMVVYEKDTGAAAVVLCDYGVFDGPRYQFTRHCRIKILKKEGVEWANKKVYTDEKLILKGMTYNLENGEIVETKLKKESIFEERVENQIVACRFSLPNVKEGSIIEYEYTFSGMASEWNFQMEIPVIWSELRILESEFITLSKTFSGYFPLSINEPSRWVAKDIPAFKSEPYINSATNYMTKFEFEIRKVSIPGRLYREYSTSWEKIDENLLKSNYFGEKLKGLIALNKEAELINEQYKTPIEKATAAYDFIRNTTTWDETYGLYTQNDLGPVLKNKKSGNCADINLILVNLLRKLELKAYPVILSTRSNGIILPFFPSRSKLNYVIACVEIDGKTHLMDATDRYAPFGLIPQRCINGDGRIVDELSAKWIKLSSNKKSKEYILNNLTLSPLGELSGEMTVQYADYAAYNFRKNLAEYTSHDEYIKTKENSILGLEIQDYELSDVDSIYKPVKAKYVINLNNKADVIDNNIYINPMLFNKMDYNPFKLENREYPVDYTYPYDETYILNLTIPEGYEVEQLPKSVTLKLNNNKCAAVYSITKNNNMLQFKYQFLVNQEVILQPDYGELKQFYDMLIKKHSEVIVLKKINS